MFMLNLRKKEKRIFNFLLCCFLLYTDSSYTYKRPIFAAINFTNFEFDNIKYNMPYLCIPAYMMLFRKSVISFDFHKYK